VCFKRRLLLRLAVLPRFTLTIYQFFNLFSFGFRQPDPLSALPDFFTGLFCPIMVKTGRPSQYFAGFGDFESFKYSFSGWHDFLNLWFERIFTVSC